MDPPAQTAQHHHHTTPPSPPAQTNAHIVHTEDLGQPWCCPPQARGHSPNID